MFAAEVGENQTAEIYLNENDFYTGFIDGYYEKLLHLSLFKLGSISFSNQISFFLHHSIFYTSLGNVIICH